MNNLVIILTCLKKPKIKLLLSNFENLENKLIVIEIFQIHGTSPSIELVMMIQNFIAQDPHQEISYKC